MSSSNKLDSSLLSGGCPLCAQSLQPAADSRSDTGPAAPERRLLIGAMTAALAAGGLPGRNALAQEAAGKQRASPARRIDVHHHVLPPAFLKARPGMPGNFTQWTPAAAIELMDRCNIATGITSLNAPGVVGSDLQKDRALARDCNEFAAQMTRDHPKRFGAFAAIPALDVEGSLREMAYALDTLHADGIGLMTSYGTTYLGSNHFLPILEELNRRKAVLFVHPAIPQFGQAFDPPVQPSYLEMPFDTARTIMSLLLNGAFTRFADIRFIFSHGGGGLPLLYRRIDYIFGADEKLRERFPNGLMAALRNVHFEMTNVLDGASYAMLRQLYRLDRMLFGTDNPAMPASVNAEYFDRLQMSDAERRAIGRENALKLFPRFA